MARKVRNLASFDELANTNKDINANDNNNEKININDEVKNVVNDDSNINTNKDLNTSDNISNDINDNANINVNDEKSQKDYLDKLLEGKAKKTESNSVLTGIYLQKDLAQVLDRLGKKGGRGAKSRIVNDALRSVFKEKGLL